MRKIGVALLAILVAVAFSAALATHTLAAGKKKRAKYGEDKRATKMEDFKGMKIRTPGWYMDILNLLGASVTPLPGSEIYLARERGVIVACEFSSPAGNYPMGFQDITKYIIEPGMH